MFPVLFEYQGYALSSFGVMMATAFLVGGWMAARSFEREGLSANDAWHLVTWAMIGGVLGAKLWYVGDGASRPQRDCINVVVRHIERAPDRAV